MDEPFTGIAPLIAREIVDIIEMLRDEGVTLLLVEQNAKISLRLADYGYVLDAGKIVLEGDGAALRDDERIMKIYIGD